MGARSDNGVTGRARVVEKSRDGTAAQKTTVSDDTLPPGGASRHDWPVPCCRIVLNITLTAGGTPRQRRMERRPPAAWQCGMEGGEERKKRFAERSLRAALPHEGASGPAVDTCCLSPVWNTGCLCGNERCRPCRSKGTRHAQSHQHNSATERFPLRGEVSNHKGIFDERTPAAVKRSRRVGCIRIRPARRPGGGEVAVRPGPGVKPASRYTGLAGRYFQT